MDLLFFLNLQNSITTKKIWGHFTFNSMNYENHWYFWCKNRIDIITGKRFPIQKKSFLYDTFCIFLKYLFN